jgi:hypothetical protein
VVQGGSSNRWLGGAVVAVLLAVPVAAPAAETAAVSLGFGWVSPVADPEVSEGYGGSAAAFVRFYDWFGGRLAIDVAHHELEGSLGEIPYPYMNGDIVFGPAFEVTPLDSPFAVRLYLETGAYWSSYLIGLVWTWGLDFGSTLLWRMTDFLGLQLDLRYHLYNLGSVDEDQLLCPRTLQPLGVVDRFDLIVAVVMTI